MFDMFIQNLDIRVQFIILNSIAFLSILYVIKVCRTINFVYIAILTEKYTTPTKTQVWVVVVSKGENIINCEILFITDH